jgi:PAS domain S-box-containing protein
VLSFEPKDLPAMTETRILVIEDEETIQDAIAELLSCETIRALTVAEALAVEGLDQLDLVLVDKNLPDGSGLDIIRELKSLEPDLEFVIMTGFPTVNSAIEAIEVGAFDYIPKPFDLNELTLKVNNAVIKTRLARRERTLALEVAESEMRYRAIFAASSDAIIIMKSEGQRIMAANVAAQQLYGYEEAALLELRGPDLVAEEGQTIEYPVSGKTTTIRTDQRRDGARLTVETSRGSASFGGTSVIVEVIRDISTRLRAEQEREQIDMRLRKSEKMETLGQLAAGIAHDYSNLLVVFMSVVSELGDWLEGDETMTKEDAEASLEELNLATQSAANLTRQLLGFSRRQTIFPERLDLSEVVPGLVQLLRRIIPKHVAIKMNVAEGLPRVWMDRGQLEQVITNLAINSRDAMPDGGALHISVGEAQGSDAEDVEVVVRDTRSGIAPDVIKRIFEPFFTTKGPEVGTGLGLANVQTIINSSGGSISISSIIGEGTTFTIRLPASKRRGKATDGVPVASMTRGRGERILVVEDHPGVRASIERLLTKAGYRITCANSGEAGLATLESAEAFDLLLVDMVLPEMQGDAVALQASEKFKLPTLCMSAFDLINDTKSPKPPATFPFIAKPFTGDRLLSRVREVLERSAT